MTIVVNQNQVPNHERWSVAFEVNVPILGVGLELA